ncbi:hypothetical protein YC2023_081415 [Brassica napus]
MTAEFVDFGSEITKLAMCQDNKIISTNDFNCFVYFAFVPHSPSNFSVLLYNDQVIFCTNMQVGMLRWVIFIGLGYTKSVVTLKLLPHLTLILVLGRIANCE